MSSSARQPGPTIGAEAGVDPQGEPRDVAALVRRQEEPRRSRLSIGSTQGYREGVERLEEGPPSPHRWTPGSYW